MQVGMSLIKNAPLSSRVSVINFEWMYFINFIKNQEKVDKLPSL